MSNLIQSTTELAMYMASGYIFPGSVLVDATCGNGHDTLQLAKAQPAKLYAFDRQPDAIYATQNRLIAEGFEEKLNDGTISLLCDSHEYMADYIMEPVNVFLFNLGYLPGGDKNFVTTSSSTISAVITAMSMLAENGLICITMYSGHPEGYEEKEALLMFSMELDPSLYHVSYVNMINQPNFPPEILLITRKA